MPYLRHKTPRLLFSPFNHVILKKKARRKVRTKKGLEGHDPNVRDENRLYKLKDVSCLSVFLEDKKAGDYANKQDFVDYYKRPFFLSEGDDFVYDAITCHYCLLFF